MGHRWPLRAGPGRFGLFWQVFGLNAGLLTLAVILLATTPATVSHPITIGQLLLLIASAAVGLAANALLIRTSLRSLRRLVRRMQDVDLLERGKRLEVGGPKEIVVVTRAFNAMLDRLERERRASTTRTVEGLELERRRIANDLHDQIGQNLTALLFVLQPALEEAPEELAPALREAQTIARTALDETSRVARQLRPTVLDDLGLTAALRSLCASAEQTSGLVVEQQYADALPALTPEVELTLYRIGQEALTNVARHANASSASVSLDCRRGVVALSIADDGAGMIHPADVELGGIRGMRERASAVGGEVRLASSPTAGTIVTVEVPVT